MRKTLLIFGASSFVGSNLLEILKDEYRIIGTFHKTPVNIPGILCVPCNVLRKEEVNLIVSQFRPDITLYAVGMSSLKECSLRPKTADALNSSGAINCSIATERVNGKFIYLSSAFVLSGSNNLYREGDTPFPVTHYGNTLSSTEFYIQRSSLNYLILRCCSLYGRSFNPEKPNWFEMLERSFLKSDPFEVDDNVVMGFLDVQILGKILLEALRVNIPNRLLNVTSRNFMTRYDFAKEYAKTFKKNEGQIQKGLNHFPYERSQGKVEEKQFFKMDYKNIELLTKVQMPSIEESLLSTKRKLA